MHTSTTVTDSSQIAEKELTTYCLVLMFFTLFLRECIFCFGHDVHVYSTSIFQIRSFYF